MITVVEAALPPARTLPATSWGEGVPGAGPLFPKRAARECAHTSSPGRVTARHFGLAKW
jgi:hypothetical protein